MNLQKNKLGFLPSLISATNSEKPSQKSFRSEKKEKHEHGCSCFWVREVLALNG
jgi:hypothetical protein